MITNLSQFIPFISSVNIYYIQAITTGICDILDDAVVEGPVEYFDLTGHRIANPAVGQMVIKRQGNKATKMLVK